MMTQRLALLVLVVAVTCSAVPQDLTKAINGDDTDDTDTDKKFFGPFKPITDGIGTAIGIQNTLTTLLGGALGAGAGVLGSGVLGNKPGVVPAVVPVVPAVAEVDREVDPAVPEAVVPPTGLQNPLTTLLLGGLLGAGLGAGGTILANKPNNNCGGGGFGRRRRQAGDAEDGGDPNDPNSKFFGLFGNNGNDCNNPCGRKRRQADGVDTGEKVDSKFFGLFGNGGGNNNPCGNNGNNQQPQGFNNNGLNNNQGGFNNNQGGFNNNQGGFNNNQGGFNNNQGFNNQNRICQCTNFSKRNNGYEEAQCARNDHTGRRWCYSTSNSQCGDAVFSKQHPGLSWSYQACGSGIRGATTSSVCECSSISKKDNQGVEEAQCAKADHTGKSWCYSTSDSKCSDATDSSKHPSNPWSYQACSSGNTSG